MPGGATDPPVGIQVHPNCPASQAASRWGTRVPVLGSPILSLWERTEVSGLTNVGRRPGPPVGMCEARNPAMLAPPSSSPCLPSFPRKRVGVSGARPRLRRSPGSREAAHRRRAGRWRDSGRRRPAGLRADAGIRSLVCAGGPNTTGVKGPERFQDGRRKARTPHLRSVADGATRGGRSTTSTILWLLPLFLFRGAEGPWRRRTGKGSGMRAMNPDLRAGRATDCGECVCSIHWPISPVY